jgi:hypothetical protein
MSAIPALSEPVPAVWRRTFASSVGLVTRDTPCTLTHQTADGYVSVVLVGNVRHTTPTAYVRTEQVTA